MRRDNARVLVIFVDECQQYGEGQLTHLKDVGILLHNLPSPIHTIVCLAGQTGTSDLIANLKSKNRRDLVKRFFKKHRYLAGVRSKAELKDFLEMFDQPEIKEFPEGSNVCYTHFFLPKAYAGEKEWRLASQAPLLWQVIVEATPNGQAIDVGMEALVGMIRSFFVVNQAKDSAKFRGTRAMWQAALDSSDFRELLDVERA